MLCIDQLGSMLNGDIMEYENIGLVEDFTDDENIAIAGLVMLGAAINFVAAFRPLCRLRGGVGTLSLRQGSRPFTVSDDQIRNTAEFLYNQTFGRYYNRTKTVDRPVPRPGAGMLAWKNSLTKMYHTYQIYRMCPILYTKNVYTASGVDHVVHRTQKGMGPHLYWSYSMAKYVSGTPGRELGFATLNYWDGGMDGQPTEVDVGPPYIPKKNYGLGASGTVYVFAADWPGTIMNPDGVTHNTSDYKYLEWLDYAYQGTVTTRNYPRSWKSVFANENWQYITSYGIRYVFDVTNYHYHDYTLEISLFKFKADVSAMDYEKQCLAHFGGYHYNTNAYIQGLESMPLSDISVIKTRRYKIPGNKTQVTTEQWTEGPNKPNNRRIRFNIKKKLIIKRPLLNSYETNLTEADIFNNFYTPEKGIYMRIMAWPDDPSFATSISGLVYQFAGETTNPSIPRKEDDKETPDRVGQGLGVDIYRKAYFKLDETTENF